MRCPPQGLRFASMDPDDAGRDDAAAAFDELLGALEEFWRDGADEDGPAPTASGRDDGDPAVVDGTPAEAKGGVRQ